MVLLLKNVLNKTIQPNVTLSHDDRRSSGSKQLYIATLAGIVRQSTVVLCDVTSLVYSILQINPKCTCHPDVAEGTQGPFHWSFPVILVHHK